MFKTGTSLSRTLKLVPAAGAIAALIALGGSALSQEAPGKDEVFGVTSIVTLPNGQQLVAFDISWVDQGLGLYYLADRTNKAVDVVNTSTSPPSFKTQFDPGFVGVRGKDSMGNVCAPINGTTCKASNDISGPDGVLTLSNNGVKQLWVGDGMSRVWVLNATTGAVVTPPAGGANPIPTSSGPTIIIPNNQNRADELCFDSADKLVMIANNADNPPFASIISIETFKVVAQIAFNGSNGAPNSNNGAEQCQWSPKTGLFYISIPGIVGGINGGGGVAVINPKTKTVIKTFLIDGNDCIAPQGMAVGPSNQILLGCNGVSGNGKFSTVIINQNSGAITKVLDNESGADEVWFNPDDGHYFLARSGAKGPAADLMQQLGIVDSSGGKEDQSVPTVLSSAAPALVAHSVAAVDSEAFVPIPGSNSTFPNGASTVCASDSLGGSNTQGCIAVFTVIKGKDDKFARQRGQDDKQE